MSMLPMAPFAYQHVTIPADAALLNVRLNATAIKQKAKQIQAIAVACDDQRKVCVTTEKEALKHSSPSFLSVDLRPGVGRQLHRPDHSRRR